MGISTELTINRAAQRACEHYESLDPLYRLFWGKHLHHGLFQAGRVPARQAQVALLDYLAAIASVPAYSHVLDVGCGYGETLFYLAKRFRCRSTGLTISPVQAEYARRRARATGLSGFVNIHVSDAESYGLGGARYDLVFAIESTEHFADRANFFRKAARLLQPGGALLLACWTVASDTDELRRLAELCACECFQSIDTYSRQILDAGLRITHSEELTSTVAPTWDIIRKRISFLMPTLRLWPVPVRQFAGAIDSLHLAFHTRDLQYWVVRAQK